ncbi:MAG: two-component system sensor histidine kinase NtrB [Hyphomicrobiaceae bacterium]
MRLDTLKTDEARKRLEAIIDASVFAIVTIDVDGVIEDFNLAAEKMFGYASTDVLGQNVSILMPEPYRSLHDAYLRDYLNTGERKIIGIGREVMGLRRDGSHFPIHLTVSEVQLSDRRLFTGMIEDISQRVDAEQRVEQLQKELIHVARLSAMGELASALAHELNQPLTAITNYSNAARRLIATQKPELAIDLVLKASDQALRAGEIIRRLRQFVESGETERSVLDLEPVVREAANLGLVGARAARVNFRFSAATDLPRVIIDRIQIQQVVQNLVRNAVDALEGWHGDREVAVDLARAASGDVVISVVDNGPGLAPEVRDKLFQPFITTKANGMGVGLSVCRNIVEAHGGQITAGDGKEGGACFNVVLPVARD